MEIDYISYSSSKLFLDGCQRLFWERKVNNYRTFFDTEYFAKGKAIHKCLENYYLMSKSGESFSEKDFNAIFATFGIINKKTIKESYDVFLNYVATRNYEKFNIIQPEYAFDTYTEDGIRIKGFMDLVYKDGEDLYVVDFKSDIVERPYDIQKIIYSVAIRNLFKAKRYFFTLDFILSDAYTYEITDDIYNENLQIIESMYDGMKRMGFEDLEYRVGAHCASCPGEILKTCPYYKQALACATEAKAKLKKIDSNLLKERENLGNYIKILTNRKSEIDKFIKNNYEKENFSEKKNSSIKIIPNKRYDYNFNKLYSKFGDKLFDAAKVTATDLKFILNKEEMKYVDSVKETKIVGNKIMFLGEEE